MKFHEIFIIGAWLVHNDGSWTLFMNISIKCSSWTNDEEWFIQFDGNSNIPISDIILREKKKENEKERGVTLIKLQKVWWKLIPLDWLRQPPVRDTTVVEPPCTLITASQSYHVWCSGSSLQIVFYQQCYISCWVSFIFYMGAYSLSDEAIWGRDVR
jgi:hypothetical protein